MNDFALVTLIQHMSKIGKVVFAGNFISKVIVWLLEYKATKRSRFLSASKRLYKLMCRLKCKKKKRRRSFYDENLS